MNLRPWTVASLACCALAAHAAGVAGAEPAKRLEFCVVPLDAKPFTGPLVLVEPRSRDCGTVQQGAKIRCAFSLHSCGTAPLEVTGVALPDGCAMVGQPKKGLAPSEDGSVEIEIDSAPLSGAFIKVVTLKTNSADGAETVLEIRGVVRPPVSVSSPYLAFPALADPEHMATETVTLRSEVDADLRLSDLRSDNPAFRPALREIVPGKEYALAVTTTPGLAEGRHDGRISLRTNHPGVPTVSVAASLTILPALQVVPSAISVSEPVLAAKTTRQIVLMNRLGADLRVTDLRANAPGVDLSVQRSADGKMFIITVTLPAGLTVRGAEPLAIRGNTDHPKLPSFEVPLVYAPAGTG